MNRQSLDRPYNVTPAHIFSPRETPSKRSYAGFREDLGIYVRSRWEANFCRYLCLLVDQGKIHRFEYEPETFWFEGIKRGTRSYTPDFKLWDEPGAEPYYIEVKGWFDAKSKTKLKRMAKYYPEVRIVLVMKDEYREISKWKSLIPHWEE